MPDLPSGVVTFLFTDIENSTRLWEQHPDAMRAALSRHDALAHQIIEAHGGTLVKPRGEGDSLFITFALATDALMAAAALQNTLLAEAWPPETPIKVRMALHTGEADERAGDYYGSTVNRCARIRATAHGGQILLSQSTFDLVRDHLPLNVSLDPLGAHRLKDLQRPEHLWQLRHPDWPSDFPPLRSLEIYKHNLPRQLTSFIGREADIATVKSLLRGKPNRFSSSLLTLTGSGGSGKTRLALQVAADLVDAYTDGAWLVELAPLPSDANADAIAKAIASSLRVREQPGQDTLTTLCEHLESKFLLLLLDNCEHLEKACVQILHALLTACPTLHILATSRVQFSLVGETAWRVPALPFPPKDQTVSLSDAMQYESVRLFAERASAVLPSFRLTVGNLPHVVQICRRLDGIPLAIELAAARVSVMGIKQIAERLDKALSFLKIENTPQERHRTLRAVIEWSHDRLEDAEKTLLRRLSVFVGGWTLEAAEAVCAWGEIDHWEVVDLLSRLVHTSLVTMQDASIASPVACEDDEESPCRYYLLETLRQFGQEKLTEFGETEQARDQHLHYFLNLAEQAEPELTGPQQAQWLQCLEIEHDNFRAALTWAIDGETRLRLAGALWTFWSMRSYFSEGVAWLRGALERQQKAPPLLRAKALNGLGVLTMRENRYQEARLLIEEGLRLRRHHGDEYGSAESLNSLANLLREQNQSEAAEALFRESLELRRKLNDTRGMAGPLNNLGILARDRKDLVQARAYFEEGLRIFTLFADQSKIAITLINLGVVCQDQEDCASACHFYEQALAIYTTLKNRRITAFVLHNLGSIAMRQNDYARAREYFTPCLNLRLELNEVSTLGCTLLAFVQMHFSAKRYITACELLGFIEAQRDKGNVVFAPHDQEEYELCCQMIGNSKQAEPLRVARSQGRDLSVQNAVALALQSE